MLDWCGPNFFLTASTLWLGLPLSDFNKLCVSESAVSFLGGAAVKATYKWCIAPTWQDKLPTFSPYSAQAKKIALEQQRNGWNISRTFKSYEIWHHVGWWWRGLMAPRSKSKKSRRSWIPQTHAKIFSETWPTLYQSSQRLFPGNLNLKLRCENPKRRVIFISSTAGQVVLCWFLPGLLECSMPVLVSDW